MSGNFENPFGTAGALIRNTWITKRPYLVYFKPTARCDLRCKICNRWKEKSSSAEELGLSEIESFLSVMKRNGATVLILWGGEPTLRKDLPEILNLAKSLGYRISMCTNLNSLEKKAERLLPNLDTLLCSLDGYGKNHDDARGLPGLFDKAVRAIEKSTEYKHLRIKIWAALHRFNTKDIEPLAKLAKELGVWIEYFPVALIENYNEELVLQNEELETAFGGIVELKRAGYPVWNLDSVLRIMGENRHVKCNIGRIAIHFNHRGDVYSCEDPEGNPLHSWGNIRDIDLTELISSKEFRDVGLGLSSCQKCRLPCALELSNNLLTSYAGMFWQSMTRS
ncbi:radical SAM protein [candidate division KSB3 bacterium]|uniref:Radical SAM protein n=1 Tax=candidate division KSB3 bacterium TaxID=2044937 RepID=A0A9D5JYR8_9BACT|nr:radical SAM protein [candidate division KSB3 bacterium]